MLYFRQIFCHKWKAGLLARENLEISISGRFCMLKSLANQLAIQCVSLPDNEDLPEVAITNRLVSSTAIVGGKSLNYQKIMKN